MGFIILSDLNKDLIRPHPRIFEITRFITNKQEHVNGKLLCFGFRIVGYFVYKQYGELLFVYPEKPDLKRTNRKRILKDCTCVRKFYIALRLHMHFMLQKVIVIDMSFGSSGLTGA